jgi:molybdopterin-guanine dinucleotide biosynthesis protein MobB
MDTSAAVSAVPVISFIGWSGSGKTTFLEQVVRHLSSQGVRVGVLKHHGHTSTVDVEGKDTWRYAQAGATPVVISSAAEYAIIRKVSREKTLEELATLIADEVDLIVTEGFRRQAQLIIEFRRTAYNNEPIFPLERISALVCDDEASLADARAAGARTFSLDEPAAVAAFLKDMTAN